MLAPQECWFDHEKQLRPRLQELAAILGSNR